MHNPIKCLTLLSGQHLKIDVIIYYILLKRLKFIIWVFKDFYKCFMQLSYIFWGFANLVYIYTTNIFLPIKSVWKGVFL